MAVLALLAGFGVDLARSDLSTLSDTELPVVAGGR